MKSFFEKPAAIVFCIVAALFAIYALTAPRTVTLEDDGLFILAAIDAGVAHPPGYPLFVFLGHIFSLIPIGEPAFRLHLLSGLFGAAACGFLLLIARQAGVSVWASAVCALCWGLSEHFWSQAIIAEVYTLNALLCAATLYFCIRARGERGEINIKPLTVAAVFFGLGLANHWPLMALASVGFFAVLPRRRQIAGLLPRLAAVAFPVAAAFYIWMVWRSHQPVTAFTDRLRT